jgi:hypothetical protein
MLWDYQFNAPKFEVLQTVIMEQGCKANAVLDALKGTIDNMIKSVVIFQLHNIFLGRNI